MYLYDQRPSTRFTQEAESIIAQLKETEYTVFIGRNNCGKSYLLKTLTERWGDTATYIGPSRYNNFNILGYYTPNSNRRREHWNNFRSHFQHSQQNIDNTPLNLQQAIAELSDTQRKSLFAIIKILLNVDLTIRDTVEGNTMSQKYISCGGHNLSFTSSGFRLIATLLTSLLNTDYNTFLIDEPELGISPEAQGVLADFLFDRSHRQTYFSHIKTVIFATHSTVFLDRRFISNNCWVSKTGDEINIRRIADQGDFNNIHFFLLGNRFETLYLPSLIIIVEGKTDHKFIERVIAVSFPVHQFSIINATSDNRIKEVVSLAKSLLSDIHKSPYRDRIFVVLDSTHEKGLPQQLEAMGIQKDKITVWGKNGIEHFYPPSLVDDIYGAGADLTISEDKVSRNGISYTKNELCDKVVARVTKETALHTEFVRALLDPIAHTLGIKMSA